VEKLENIENIKYFIIFKKNLNIYYYNNVVMDLAVEPDIYEPNMDENGNYLDYLPPSSKFKNGLRCHCGARKDHVFDSRASFTGHIKTKTHQKWLADLNLNKMNYFTENIKLQETIANQKIIIAKLQRENDENIKMIAHLSKKIEIKENSHLVPDLLTFD
jgi:hypothetical protein